jgi:hypothetical protein
MMLLANPIFKNLNDKDHKTLIKLIYKAEMIESYMRDKQIIRVNDSFEEIVDNIANMLNQSIRDDRGDEEDDYRDEER